MGKWINIDDLPSGRVEWEDLFDAPSIDIVRCGECIYWKNSLCQAWHRVIPKDGYCSIGERDGSTQKE